MDNHYIILRKNRQTKQVEYLRVLDCKRHEWNVQSNNSTIFASERMNKKIKDLSRYGKKDFIYYPQYVYQQGNVFNG